MSKSIVLLCSIFALCFCHGAIAAVPTGYSVSNYQTYDTTGATEVFVATTGNDTTGNGSIGTPWATLGKALLSVSGNTVIYLRGGSYGHFQQLGNDGYAAWVTIKPYNGEEVIFNSFDMSFDARYYPSNVRFDGFKINLVNDGHNAGFAVRYGQNIEVRNLVITGYDKYISEYGIKITSVENFLLYRNTLTKFISGMYAIGIAEYLAEDMTVAENHVYDLSGATPFSYSGYCANAVVERNNFHDSQWVSGDPGAPVEPTHGSCMSIRSSGVLFRHNICHHLGSSSGIMTYTDDGSAASYHDIYIWDNLMYDMLNEYIIRFYNVENNIEVKNNTIIGYLTDDVGSWGLGQSVFVHTLYTGFDGSGITVANNILAGWSSLPTTANVTNNIMFAASYMHDPFTMLASWAGNTVLTSSADEPTDYFTSGFFDGTVNLTYNHGQILGYQLESESPAVNYGSTSLQTSPSLGPISSGFVTSGGDRSAAIHSAGAYELIQARRYAVRAVTNE